MNTFTGEIVLRTIVAKLVEDVLHNMCLRIDGQGTQLLNRRPLHINEDQVLKEINSLSQFEDILRHTTILNEERKFAPYSADESDANNHFET